MNIIRQELIEIKNKYGDERRTRITAEEEDLELEDLIAEEDVVITVTHRGYIKRIPLDTYRSQRRGGKGITGLTTREEDFVEHLFVATTHHNLMFFSSKGKVYRLKAYEIPEAGRQARGMAIVNLLPLQKGEVITAIIPVRDFTQEGYLFMATKEGTVKKTYLDEYNTSRKEGIVALTLRENDELVGVKFTDGSREMILVTKKGYAIRFHEDDVRSMGRTAQGVKGITLRNDDEVVSLDCVREGADLLVITEKGFGKRTPLEEYRVQNRGGMGVLAARLSARNGLLAAASVVQPEEELMIISSEGIIIRMAVNEISTMGRVTQGVTLMRLGEDDRVVALAKVVSRENGEEKVEK
jgi:DNA gyrase subunit A